MNNSKFAIDSIPQEVDRKPLLREREQHLVNIIEALERVAKSRDWSSLKIEVFDSLVTTLERELREEAKKDSPDALKLNRLAGQLKWAEKYADLNKLAVAFRVELNGIKIMLHGKSE